MKTLIVFIIIRSIDFTRATKVWGYSSMALGPSISSHAIALVNMQMQCTLFVKNNKETLTD